MDIVNDEFQRDHAGFIGPSLEVKFRRFNNGKWIGLLNIKKITHVLNKGQFIDNRFLYIGRANRYLNLPESMWHNPFHLKRESDRPQILQTHLEYVIGSPNLMSNLRQLSGHILVCYCCPRQCHGDNLMDLYEKHVASLNYCEIGADTISSCSVTNR